jgi:hypothetical protein
LSKKTVALLALFSIIVSFGIVAVVSADVHYESWTAWHYMSLDPEDYYMDDALDGRATDPNKDYCGVDYELVVISPSGYSIDDYWYWCDGIPDEYWYGNPTYPNGGILHVRFENNYPYTEIYFKYRWRLMWEDP